MDRQAIPSLQKRPKFQNSQFRQLQLTTNYKLVKFQYPQIYLYSIQFSETSMGPINRPQYLKLIKTQKNKLSAILGINFVYSGRTLYGFQNPGFKQKKVEFNLQNKVIIGTINLIKKIDLKNLSTQALMFLNSSLKNVLRQLGYNQIGKSKKYFNIKQSQNLGEMLLYRGFETCFVTRPAGLLLKIEAVNRIIQKQSVLDFINNLYLQNQIKSTQEKREIVREKILHRSVMVNYGTRASWIIDDVVFDKDMENLKLEDGTKNFNLLNYYKQVYGIKINNPKQPLLQAFDKFKKLVFLIPQLCHLSGIIDNIDNRKRMQISKMTIQNASLKFKKIVDFDTQLKSNVKAGWGKLKQMGIQVQNDFMRITAEEIETSELMMGENPPGSKMFDSIRRGDQKSFQLFNKCLFKNNIQLNLLIIHFQYPTKNMKDIFKKTSQNILMAVSVTEKDLGHFDNNWFDNLTACVQNKRNSKINMILFILPAKAKSKYPDIKKLCYSDKNNCINSQVVLQSKLNQPKLIEAVSTKILLQMAVKIGNILWVPKPPKTQIKIMIIGIAIAKIPNSKSSVIAYNSSKDSHFSRYHNSYCYQNGKSTTIMQKVGQIILQCVKHYKDFNNDLPQVVLILRQGTTEAQSNILNQTEVTDSVNSLGSINKQIKLIFISINKNPTTKIYKVMDKRAFNPSVGTLVRSQIVAGDSEFYLIGSQNQKSASVPVYFKVLLNNTSDKTTISSGFLAKLLYSQCFNYMNWTGSVRVPAQLQYACKLAKFKSEVFKDADVHQELQSHIYFI